MRRIIVICVLVIVALLLIAQFGPSLVRGETVRSVSPIFGVTIPDGYRDWKMIAVAHEVGLDELRGVLGNEIAAEAYQQRTLPVGSCPMEGLELPQKAPQAFARKQIAADSIDAVERGHDISRTVDPGHCLGARYERAAKHRSRHHAF